VTTEVIGNCGHGCAPIVSPRMARAAIYGPVDATDMGWRSVADYLARLEGVRPAVNVLALVPNGQLRLACVAEPGGAATADELRAMARMLEAGLEEGAFGYSTGLEYAQERGAPEDEVVALCRIVARRGGLYATHTRERDAFAAEAVDEAIRTARAAGARLQVSHIVPRSGVAVTQRCLDLVGQAADAGLDVAFDMHTRLFGFTHLKNIAPSFVLEGDADAIRARLHDPAMRARIAAHPNLIAALGDWERVLLVVSREFAALNGVSFAEIGRRWKRTPLDAACDVLAGEAHDVLRPMVILQSYSEALLGMAYRDARCMIGSDATTLAPDGPLAGETFHGAYTWAAWFWRRMVRETGLLRPEAAVARLTELPARTIGLADRGRLAVGMAADIAAFDAGRFGERGSVTTPNLTATGMVHVVVNGVPTLRDGVATGARGGRVIRR
jgi:N-acyl-D-aspartate/D-glutamate deacylase